MEARLVPNNAMFLVERLLPISFLYPFFVRKSVDKAPYSAHRGERCLLFEKKRG